MKKVIVVLLFVFIQTIVNAQSPISEGALTFGGNISFSSQSFDKSSDNSTVFTFNPQIGYFFFDNFYSAISINYDYYSSGGSSNNKFGIGPAIRYYFDLEKIKPFLGIGFTYSDQSNSGSDNIITTTEFKLTGGMDFFFTSYFALEASINYSFINYDYSSGFHLYDSDQSKLFQIAVGVNYFIY
jgi:outer membrane protein W